MHNTQVKDLSNNLIIDNNIILEFDFDMCHACYSCCP